MQRLLMSTLCALALAAPAAGRAEGYPSKPIRFVCTFAPGGGTDITARVVGQKLSEMFGLPVVVENRPGAGGTIGAASVAKTPPDGYTIMLGSVSVVRENSRRS